MTKKQRSFLLAAGLSASVLLFCHWQNNGLVVTELPFVSPHIPAAFDGFRIVQVSDLHNKRFGEGQSRLTHQLQALSPDIIVVTGDLMSDSIGQSHAALEFIRNAKSIAPIYYIPGNHEARLGDYPVLARKLAAMGVTVLECASVRLERGGDAIDLLGIRDPDFGAEDDTSFVLKELYQLVKPGIPDGKFRILLSHRPDLLELYAMFPIDLVFTGHAHGGQFRLPGVEGLYAPDQGILPEYTSGLHRHGSTAEVISRGLGGSTFPQRMFNRPEIVAVTLRRGNGRNILAESSFTDPDSTN